MSSIVGGGIGGLFAANALIAHGLRVSVYEQAPALGEIGAGVFLTPNSVRHLQRLGLGAGSRKIRRTCRDRLALLPPRRRADRAGAGDGLLGLERDVRHAPRRPRRSAGDALPAGVVHTGHRCTGFEQNDDMARVSFANGAAAKPMSSSRRTASIPSFVLTCSRRRGRCSHGSVAYRGLVPHERIPHWPTERWQMWLGTGKHFLAFPVRAGTIINYVGLRAGGRGDEGIVVGPRRSRRPSPRVRRLGPAHRGPAAARAD